MLYLVGEILFCLFFAAFIGFAIGWLLRGPGSTAQIQKVDTEWRGRMATLQRERDRLVTEFREQSEAARGPGKSEEQLAAALADSRARVSSAEAQMATMKKALQQERSQAEALRMRIAKTEADLKSARALTAGDAGRNDDVVAQLREQLAAESARSRMLSGDTQTATARMADMEKRSKAREETLAALQEELATATARMHGLKAQLTAARERPTDHRPAGTDAPETTASSSQDRARIANLEERLAAHAVALKKRDQVIARLKQQLKAPGQRELLADEPQEEALAMPPAAPAPVATAAQTQEPSPAWRLDAPDGPPDDLRRIYGIGPVLQKTLNSLGVYHFRQIAAFTPQDVLWIARHINSFPDRIVRDGWVAQARRFEAEK